MMTPLPTLDSIFPPWKGICKRYDELCAKVRLDCPSPTNAVEKEESIHWEQFAFEAIIMLLLGSNIPFETSADEVQRTVRSIDGIAKEIDFAIKICGEPVYFGVTSFSDSEKDLKKDFDAADIEIKDLKRSDGRVSGDARITSIRRHDVYLNRRLAVRVATEGKHVLDSNYVYIAFPKRNRGFGGGLDAIPKSFSFVDDRYHYRANGICGLIVIGEYLEATERRRRIIRDVLLVKASAFSHASVLVKRLLARFDSVTIDYRQRNSELREALNLPNSVEASE